MADAKIMTFGELFSPTIDVIPDNKAAAVEIEGLDGKDYIKIDTTDGSEAVKLVSSGMDGGVVIGTAALLKTAPNSGKPMKALQISTPATGAEPFNEAMVRFTQADRGEGQDDGAWIGLTHQNTFSIGSESPIYISTRTAGTAILIENDATTAFYKHAELRSSLSVANTSTPGTDAVAIGDGCTAAGANAVSVGLDCTASNTKTLAIGSSCEASSSGAIAIGSSCKGAGAGAMAIGPNSARAAGSYSMAIGYFTQSLQPYEQTFGSTPYLADYKGVSQRKFVSGQCQTTDGTTTAMLNAENDSSTTLVVNTTNCATTNKSNTTFFRVRVISSVTGGSEDTDFEIGEFLCREYSLAIKWFYSTSASTIELISDAAGTAIASDATIYAARENVRASNDVISHATNGIVDSIELTTSNSAARGSWNLKVASANANATIRHTCFIDQVDSILA